MSIDNEEMLSNREWRNASREHVTQYKHASKQHSKNVIHRTTQQRFADNNEQHYN